MLNEVVKLNAGDRSAARREDLKHSQAWIKPNIMVEIEDPLRVIDHRLGSSDLSCIRTIAYDCVRLFRDPPTS